MDIAMWWLFLDMGGWEVRLGVITLIWTLCDCTLETYIYGDRDFLFDEEWHKRAVNIAVVPKDDFVFMRLMNILDIMSELTEGLSFIHACKQVHRDLKPRNGIPYCIWRTDTK